MSSSTGPVRELSKGNRQKIGLVLAFMHRPDLLVLDEPTSGLDPLMQDEFERLVRETVAEGRTVFLSSHELDEVQRRRRPRRDHPDGSRWSSPTPSTRCASAAPRTIEFRFGRRSIPQRFAGSRERPVVAVDDGDRSRWQVTRPGRRRCCACSPSSTRST